MTHDVVVAVIADGGPELPSPRTINLDQNRNATDAPFGEDVLNLSHKLSADSLTTPTRMHHQTVQVASPPIESPE